MTPVIGVIFEYVNICIPEYLNEMNSESTKKAAEVLKTLGHPSRIAILLLISGKKGKKLSVKQIHESLGLTQSETSRHLIIMKNATVLNCLKESGNSYYSINDNSKFILSIVSSLNKIS